MAAGSNDHNGVESTISVKIHEISPIGASTEGIMFG
jgi:hypothetical protein